MKQSELCKYQAIKEAIEAGHKTTYATSKNMEKYKTFIKKLIPDNCQTIMDLGCGRGDFSKWLSLEFPAKHIVGVDPVFTKMCEEKHQPWRQDNIFFTVGDTTNIPCCADTMLCFDVLEHIHPEELEKSLQQIKEHTNMLFIAKIATGSDICGFSSAKGEELHPIQQPLEWWKTQLEKYFNKVYINMNLIICYK